MLFTSTVFLLGFLPLVVVGYWLINYFNLKTYSLWWLLLASIIFYGWIDWRYVPLLLISVVVNFYIGGALQKGPQKWLLILGIVFNLAWLWYFKYNDFFLSTFNDAVGTNWSLPSFLFPLGVSFYTFQQITFLMDSWHQKIKESRFWHYSLYVLFFPQVITGPIVHHGKMMKQFDDKKRHKFLRSTFGIGLFLFALGLMKKVVLADPIGDVVDVGYQNPEQLDLYTSWMVTAMYSLQLYFDFSGYTEMAVGMGLMLNLKLPFNFKSPYTAESFSEFWRRWHITLSTFLRDFVYIPLGGSRVSYFRGLSNVMIVFLLSGIWHGVGLTFIFWGAIHGAMVCFERIFKTPLSYTPGVFKWLLTLLVLNISWVYFRAPDFQTAHLILAKMFNLAPQTAVGDFFSKGPQNNDNYFWLWEDSRIFDFSEKLSSLVVNTSVLIWIPILIVLGWISWLAFIDTPEVTKKYKCTTCNTLSVIGLFFLSFLVLKYLPETGPEATRFLYARF
jgi:D-alanyl-lipoteichoic acid acyltransferase DltB (MBOAT superfamily)